VIDTSRLSLITFTNRVSNPTLSNSTYVPTESSEQQTDGTVFDRVGVVANDGSNITFLDDQIQTSNSSVQGSFRDLQAGQILEVSNASNTGNNGQYTITDIAIDGSAITVTPSFAANEDPAGATGGVNIAVYNNYVEEISPSAGTTAAKYMTRRVDLSEAAANSTGLDIRFAADVPTGAAVDVYYKTKLSANDTNYSDIIWTRVGTVSSTNVDGFVDQEFNVTGIPTFDVAAVKLVMRSDSSVNVPLVKDLIVIANA